MGAGLLFLRLFNPAESIVRHDRWPSPMFEKLRTQWNEARGSRLRKEYDDAVLRIKRLTEERNERFCKSLDYAFNKWTTDHGPIEGWPEGLRKAAVKELRAFAKQRFNVV